MEKTRRVSQRLPGPEETKRLFVAIDPPAEAAADLATALESLAVVAANAPGASTRVVPPDRWHITLAFLGDVRVSRVEAAIACLDRGCAALAVRDALPIELRVAGGGTFGRGRFTTLWAGLDGDVAGLRALAGQLRRELRRARLPHDDKPLRPHLTLARPGDRVAREEVREDVARLNEYAGPVWRVAAVSLYVSDFLTLPEGVTPTYTPIHTASL